MEMPSGAIFSLDDKFVYAIDDRKATVVVFQVEAGKSLKYVQTFEGKDRCFDGTRGIVAHPDGKTLYVVGSRSGMLTVLDRDPTTGKVALRQIVRDEQEDVHGLAGVIDVCVSRDGKFVYTVSGRWDGDNAVSAFLVGMDGKLQVLQEFINNESELKDFVGGGKGITISPDGTRLYASATRSGSLACFGRDPSSGKLTYLDTLQTEATGHGLGLGAVGVEVSPDGKFLYLAVEYGPAVSVFARTGPTPMPKL
jgi:6-phosphogluconolactonase (cycloisomerase 2 family)